MTMTAADDPIFLSPGRLTLDILRSIWCAPRAIALDPAGRSKVDAAAAAVSQVVERDAIVYGVNTGFGALARTRIEHGRLVELQRALVRSHCAGTGPLLDPETIRLVLALKIASLAQGHSGVRASTIDALVALANSALAPNVPAQGSVGASGDLAPLAHLAALLIGEGGATIDGARVDGAEALARAGLRAVTLAPKEGLALLNGTQVSTAIALAALFAFERTLSAAVVAGAMSVDACAGSDTPFDARIHTLRPYPGQRDVASSLRSLLAGSGIRASHRDCPRVQDPYSLRCQAQVAGACLDQLRAAIATLLVEANAVSDNPLVFAADGEILSGGNFHAEPVAFAADTAALAIAEIGAISERRIAVMMDAAMSGLPAFLVRDGGVNSGFMIAQVTAAALAAENKALAHPRSVDSIPTSANQEDHVSMATGAALRLLPMVAHTSDIVAIELLAATQGIELRTPLATSPPLQQAVARVRGRVTFWDSDRPFAPDLAAVRALVDAGAFAAIVPLMYERFSA